MRFEYPDMIKNPRCAEKRPQNNPVLAFENIRTAFENIRTDFDRPKKCDYHCASNYDLTVLSENLLICN